MTHAPVAGVSRRAKILRRTRVGGGLALGLGALLWIVAQSESSALVLAVSALLTLLCCAELAALLGANQAPWTPHLLAAGVAALGVWGLAIFSALEPSAAAWPLGPYLLASALAAGLSALPGLGARPAGDPTWALPTWLAVGWVAAPLGGLAMIHHLEGIAGLVAVIVLSKVGDIAGYYGGNAFGRHHPFKRLSPGKTSEGCLFSLVGALITSALLARSGCLALAVPQALVLGLAINLAAQAGDLLESRLKRGVLVKDSGSLFGPSGGFLDLVDSLLLSVPAALAVWPVLQ